MPNDTVFWNSFLSDCFVTTKINAGKPLTDSLLNSLIRLINSNVFCISNVLVNKSELLLILYLITSLITKVQ